MEQIKIENLSFAYPLSQKKALSELNLTVRSGEYILLCGKSGSGKTTLLQQLKKELAPHGERSGRIYLDGKDMEDCTLRESAERIGYVFQNPERQIVTDKVWHELAFGLENLGLDREEIRLRTAEMASYFGIDAWFDQKTSELSGGQKQLLNLASVMVMHPDILLLDEPTAQLDPIAAENFLYTVSKINRELGTTVILSEQRLEEAFACADRVIVMDEGHLAFDGTPKQVGEKLTELPMFLRSAVPTAMRVFGQYGDMTVREGRERLRSTPHLDACTHNEKPLSASAAAELKHVSFRYDKNGADVLRDLSLTIPENSFFAILGGNGAGKTTLLRVIAAQLKPYEGKLRIFGNKPKNNAARVAMLPQDVQALFTGKTVRLDLTEVQQDEEAIRKVCALTKLEALLDKHPFDLSGGEQQRAALAKVLLCAPRLLLLDEPTKGMDAQFKTDFAQIVQTLLADGCTVVMISHDVEFCARYADCCAMLFDGGIAASAPAYRFFNQNRFYTTAASRMARGIIENAVTDEDIRLCIKNNYCPC